METDEQSRPEILLWKILQDIRIRARNPSYSVIASKAQISKSTAHAAFSGMRVQWPGLLKILTALRATDDQIQECKRLWIQIGVQDSNLKRPLWVDEITNRLDTIIHLLSGANP